MTACLRTVCLLYDWLTNRHIHTLSFATQDGEFLDHLTDCQIPKDSVVWIYVQKVIKKLKQECYFFNCTVHREKRAIIFFRLANSVLSVMFKRGLLELIALLLHKNLISKSVFTYKPE